MKISKEQYEKIIKEQNDGKILLYINTAEFRKFFTEINNQKVKKLIGESLETESFFIKLIMFLLEPLSLLITIITSIFLFKWLSIPVIIVMLLIWMFVKTKASAGKQRIFFPSILLIIGIFIAIIYREQGLWFQLFAITLPATFFFTKLIYYLTARFGFMLIHRNYEFFKTFYEKPEGAAIPMIWSEKIKK